MEENMNQTAIQPEPQFVPQPEPPRPSAPKEPEEFTFAKLFKLLKKSLVRIVIYCVIAVVAFGVITIGVYFGTSKETESVSTWIQFGYAGAETGLAPDGTLLQPDKQILSNYVVNNTIDALAERGVAVKAGLTVQKITSYITVESILPQDILQKRLLIYEKSLKDVTALEELITMDTKITEYLLTIQNYQEIGMTRTVAKAFMDELVKQYRLYFNELYLDYTLLSEETVSRLAGDNVIGTDVNQYDFFESYERLAYEIEAAIDALNTMTAAAPLFQSGSTGKTFANTAKALELVQSSSLAHYRTNVQTNGLSVDATNLAASLDLRINEYQRQVDRYTTDETELLTALNNYPDQISYTTDSKGELVEIRTKSENFDKVYNEYISAIQSKNRYTALKAELEEQRNYFVVPVANTDANQAAAKSRLKSAATEVLALYREANQSVADYYENHFSADFIKVTIPATYARNQTENIKILLLVAVAVVLVVAVVAVFITNADLKKKGISLED